MSHLTAVSLPRHPGRLPPPTSQVTASHVTPGRPSTASAGPCGGLIVHDQGASLGLFGRRTVVSRWILRFASAVGPIVKFPIGF
jgi:hypothetical protein